jgi:hypothetical protein
MAKHRHKLPPRGKHGRFLSRHAKRRHHHKARRNPWISVANPSRGASARQLGLFDWTGRPVGGSRSAGLIFDPSYSHFKTGAKIMAKAKRKRKTKRGRRSSTRLMPAQGRHGRFIKGRRRRVRMAVIPRGTRRVRRVRLGRRSVAIVLRRNPLSVRSFFGWFKIGLAGAAGVMAVRAAGYWWDQKAASYVIGTDSTVKWRQWANTALRTIAQGMTAYMGGQLVAKIARPYGTVFTVAGMGETGRQVVGQVYKLVSPTSTPEKVGLGQLPPGRQIQQAYERNGRIIGVDNAGQWWDLGASQNRQLNGPIARHEFSAGLGGAVSRDEFSAGLGYYREQDGDYGYYERMMLDGGI